MRHRGGEGIGCWLSAADFSVPGTHTRWSGPPSVEEDSGGDNPGEDTLAWAHRNNAGWEDRSRGAGQPETREGRGPMLWGSRQHMCEERHPAPPKGLAGIRPKKQKGTSYETKQPEENKWTGVLGNLTLRERGSPRANKDLSSKVQEPREGTGSGSG